MVDFELTIDEIERIVSKIKVEEREFELGFGFGILGLLFFGVQNVKYSFNTK